MSKPEISRRDFLHFCAITTSGVLLTSCTGWFSSGKQFNNTEDYYSVKREDILKSVDDTLEYIQKICVEKYGGDGANSISVDTRARFEALLPDLPYIGGDQNDLTSNLIQGAAALAFYRVMQEKNKTIEETGEVLYRAVELMMRANPLSSMEGRLANSELAQSKLREGALASQNRQYQDDWVFEFVEGDGKAFDFGIDYIECGICKYFMKQGAEELIPYLCLLDFPISAAMKTGLVRTSTLGHGTSCCDFRYKTGRVCQMEWTPEFLKN